MVLFSSYEHTMTGLRTEETPKETIGGILADDMGLGKTLTVLSTIIRTADSAKSYVEDHRGNSKTLTNNGAPRIRSRATLVVVPSPCMIPSN